MLKPPIICLLLLASLALGQQSPLNFAVKNTVQSQLDAVLSALENQLRLYGTTFQDNTRLSRQIDFTYEVISVLLRELAPYNTVVQGQGNSVSGTKDIVLGSFNNVQSGGNNWIFTNYYTGSISGDLVVDGYRIQMDKKHLTLTRPDLVVFPLTPQESGNYSKYFNANNQPNGNGGMISLFKVGSIGAQQVNNYGIKYQSPPPQQPQQIPQQQIPPQQNQFQNPFQQQQQFQASQPSQSFGDFKAVSHSGSGNLRGNNFGFVETTSPNFGGFKPTSSFSGGGGSSSGFGGFIRV